MQRLSHLALKNIALEQWLMAHDLLNEQYVLLTAVIFSSLNHDVLEIILCNKCYVCDDDDVKLGIMK